MTLGGVMSGLKPKNEWMVWPLILSAATPVGASATTFLAVMTRKYSSRVDLPVPARPVMKALLPVLSMTSRARRNWSFISILYNTPIIVHYNPW